MASTPTSPQQSRPLASKPASALGPSPLSAQPNTTSQQPIFNDCAAVTPVTMGDEPYRNLARRFDSPSRQLTIEQLVDTRLCVSALTPQQCHYMMSQLSDQQIKNAVYDRALCFPSDKWTENIRLSYGRQVQYDNRVVCSFENMTQHMDSMFATWRDIYFFKEGDFDNIEAHVKSYLAPSIDNIGVYGTFSEFTATKINALAALLKIGRIIIEIPILTSQRGMQMFVYDPLSRAVANILSTTTTDTTRRQILDVAIEEEFLDLSKRASVVGLFPGLVKAIAPGAELRPYNVPLIEEPAPGSNKRASTDQIPPAAKRRKTAQGGQHTGQKAFDREGAPAPGSSAASPAPGQQLSGVAEAPGAEPSGPRNPFSRPASAGPVALPFNKSTNSSPAPRFESEDEPIDQEQIDPILLAASKGAELQGIAKGATELQSVPQGALQTANDAQGEDKPAEGARKSRKSRGPEAQQPLTQEQQQQQPQAQQAEQAGAGDGEKQPAYDDLLRRIEEEVFRAHAAEPPEEQMRRAPAVISLVEGTAGAILARFQEVARETAAREGEGAGKGEHREQFLSSLSDTAFALLWVLESCALRLGGTPLAAEVSRAVSRDALVGALWGSVRLATAAEWLDLLNVRDQVSSETFGEKLERIIRQMDEIGVVGFGDLRFILGNMRSGISVPARDQPTKPDPGST